MTRPLAASSRSGRHPGTGPPDRHPTPATAARTTRPTRHRPLPRVVVVGVASSRVASRVRARVGGPLPVVARDSATPRHTTTLRHHHDHRRGRKASRVHPQCLADPQCLTLAALTSDLAALRPNQPHPRKPPERPSATPRHPAASNTRVTPAVTACHLAEATKVAVTRHTNAAPKTAEPAPRRSTLPPLPPRPGRGPPATGRADATPAATTPTSTINRRSRVAPTQPTAATTPKPVVTRSTGRDRDPASDRPAHRHTVTVAPAADR
ncbi:hypothetical protein EV385_3129 [Krasilnikovia cinnamomea]|uniref:Uncharacterized protein n=1 Tax=Krasilnikovia cinnamomea TaxID=349313 RepID=A0A4Q7ZL56_9ACTN|nr:hypothetical protein EV385_3129 [Krasilnikovia cinnamomea]